MSVYVVASIAIENRERYEKYEAGFMEIFSRYEGEVLAVSDEPRVVEGEWPFTRAVVLRFPDEEKARAWYASPDYQALARHRWAASSASIVALEGLG